MSDSNTLLSGIALPRPDSDGSVSGVGPIINDATVGVRSGPQSAVDINFEEVKTPLIKFVGGEFFLGDEKVSFTEESVAEINFLGAKVVSFNASIGWNGNRSECSITLIEDPDPDPITGLDIIFTVPVVGSPQFFEVKNEAGIIIWHFYGVVRSVTRDVDPSRRTFTVSLESPNVILDSVSLIMTDFAGAGHTLDKQDNFLTTFNTRSYNWNRIYNVINLFGFWENDQFGTGGIRRAGFGLSDSNEAGMPWKKAVIALNEIINRTHTNDVLLLDGNNVLGGSLAFSSTSYENGKPYLYCLNIDDLVHALVDLGVPDSYRVDPASSITDLISDKLASIANVQWFCTLEKNDAEIRDTYNNELCAGIIKINVTVLRELPKLGVISGFGIAQEGEGSNIKQNKINSFPDAIGAYDFADDFSKLEQSNLGLELADVTTGKIVVGAKRSAMFEFKPPSLYMYWGSLKPRDYGLDDLPLITPLLSPTSRQDVIPIDIRDIVGDITVGEFKEGKRYWNKGKMMLPPTVYKGIYYASVLELRFAAVDYDNWESYLTNFCQKKSLDLGITGETRPFITAKERDSYQAIISALNLTTNQDSINLTRQALINAVSSFDNSQELKNLQALHEKLSAAYAMYGTEFMIPMPVTAYKWIPETADFVSEWDITDSAYTDLNNGPNSPNFDPKFLDDNGRTVSYSIFPARTTITDSRGRQITGALDFSQIDGEDFSIYGNSVYIKTSMDTKVYYLKQMIPVAPWFGEYTFADATTSFFYPELLTPANPFLGDLPYGRPTTEFFGYYTDLRGALPFAHITLPSKVGYMKDAVGMSMSFDGIGLITNLVEDDLISQNNGIGTDRRQAPVAGGACFPSLISLPLQSNRHHYGPWLPNFNQNVAGKVEVEFDDTLAPENFSIGGYGYGFDSMDAVGYAKAMPDNIGYFATETGNFTMVGAPRVSLGQQIIEGGPYLTDLDVSVDNATIKTSFKMKTWNLDFGKAKRYFIDRILRLSKTQIKTSKAKRDNTTKFEKMVRDQRSSVAARYRGQSSSTMIAATIQPTAYYDPWQQNKFDVSEVTAAILPAHNLMSHIPSGEYMNTAASTLDAFYAPVSMQSNVNGPMPKMSRPTISSVVDSYTLNPYVQSGWIGQTHFRSGINNIHAYTRGDTLPPDLSVKHSMASDLFLEDSYSKSGEDSYNIRVVANRVPQLAVGWGFGVNGDYAPSGVDRQTNTSSWKAGPALHVWDEHKGIWSGDFPVMTGLLRKKMTAPATFGTIIAGEIIRYTIGDKDKIKMLDQPGKFSPIYCDDPSIGELEKGTIVFYVCVDGKNRILYASCGVDSKALEMVTKHG